MQNRRQRFKDENLQRFKDENGNDLYLSKDEIVTTGKDGCCNKKYFKKADPNGIHKREMQIWVPSAYNRRQSRNRKKDNPTTQKTRKNQVESSQEMESPLLLFIPSASVSSAHTELTFFNSAPEKKSLEKKSITFLELSKIISETGTIEAAAKTLSTTISDLQEIIDSCGLTVEDIKNESYDFKIVSNLVANITYTITVSTSVNDSVNNITYTTESTNARNEAWAASVLEGSDVSPKSSGPTNTGP